MPIPPPADDHRPLTRLSRLTRWVPTPKGVWRWAKARPRATAFLLGVVALLGWAASDHLVAAWTGHRLRYQGHGVTFGHTIDENLRSWAPLPADSSFYLTPVGVNYVRRNHRAGTVDEFLNAVDRMPGVQHVGFDAALRLTPAQTHRAAARHTDSLLICVDSSFEPGALTPLTSLSQITSAQLPECWLPNGELSPLAGAKKLELLYLENTHGVAGSLAPLAGHPTLKYVMADGSDFNDADLAALARCPRIVGPRLANTNVTDAGLAALNGTAQEWYSLRIADTAVTDAGLEAFGPHPKYLHCDLSGTLVGDAGVAALVRHCPNLEDLFLNRTRVTDDGLTALRPLAEQLKSLQLADAAVTGKGLAALGPCPNLDWLDLSGTAITDADLAAFPERYPNLITLDLHDTSVTPATQGATMRAIASLREQNARDEGDGPPPTRAF